MQKLRPVIIVFILLFSGLLSTGQNYPQFKSITNKDGLSQSAITAICKDSIGMMWFGTRDGLNRYDGNKIKIFRHDPNDSTSISANEITTLLFFDGYIWVGTRDGGLNRLDPRTETFKHIDFTSLTNNSKPSHIICLSHDQHGTIWAGTSSKGLLAYNPETQTKSVFPVTKTDNGSTNIPVTTIVPDGEYLWLGLQYNKLVKFSPEKGVSISSLQNKQNPLFNSITCFTMKKGDPHLWVVSGNSQLYKFNTINEEFEIVKPSKYKDFNFYSINNLLFQGDTLWITTAGWGLYLYNVKTNEKKLFSSAAHPHGILYNSLLSIFVDNTGILWVGTNGKGVSLYHPGTSKFTVFSHYDSTDYTIDISSVRSILEVGDEVLAGGYFGLNRINLNTAQREFYFSGDAVYTLCKDKNNKDLVWVGLEGGGLFSLNLSTGKTTDYQLQWESEEGKLFPFKFIFEITHYKNDLYLIGTPHGLGVFRSTDKNLIAFFYHKQNDSTSIVPGAIKNILITPEKEIWIGSATGGLSKFDFENKTFENYFCFGKKGSISSNRILSLYYGNNILWVGTDRGLNKMDMENNSFDVFTTKNGLPNNIIYGILGDEDDNLYLSTNYGLSQFNTKKNTFVNYSTQDGLPSIEFNMAAYYHGSNGVFYFGGISGMVSFTPGQLNISLPQPKPLFSKLYLFNTVIKPDTILPYKKIVFIKPGTDFISIELSAENYLFPRDNYFQYKIPKLSEKWINLGKNHKISLINQDPGKYNILIRASLDRHSWQNTPKSLQLVILPKYYETTWFKIMLLVLFIVLIGIIFYLRFRILKRQEIKLKELIDERTSDLRRANMQLKEEIAIREKTEDQLREANQTKDKFFSILAHDLKNPFSALMGFSKMLNDHWDEFDESEKIEMVRAIMTNSENTYNLLVNLLDWARLQRGSIKPHNEQVNLFETTEKVLLETKGNSNLKHQHVLNNVAQDTFVSADRFMLETIIRNLVSNAIKFTPQRGTIEITSSNNEETVVFAIKDNGTGMEENVRKKLFSVRNMMSKSGTDGESGTGLGLVITYEFIRLLNGKLWVESETGKGSIFYFLLPKSQ